MKKLIAVIIPLIVLLAAGTYYWHRSGRTEALSAPTEAIPSSAALVIRYPDLSASCNGLEQTAYGEDLLEVPQLQRFFKRNRLLDSLVRNSPELRDLFGTAETWSSYHVSESDSLMVLYVLQPSRPEAKLLGPLKTALSKAGTITSVQLQNRECFRLLVARPFISLYVTVANGLVLAASEKTLLHEALEQLTNGTGLKHDPVFSRAVRAAGKHVEANFFINYRYLPHYLKPVLRSSAQLDSTTIDLADWTELDLSLKPDGLICNGFTYTSDSTSQFLDLFHDQDPQRITFTDHLPAHTASFTFYGLSEPASFLSRHRKWKTGRLHQARSLVLLDSLKQTHGIDLEQNLASWLGNTFGKCITETPGPKLSDHTYWLMETRSEELAERLLRELSDTLNRTLGSDPVEATLNGQIIRRLPHGELFTELLGTELKDLSSPYYIVLNGYVVMASSQQALHNYAQYIQADRVLSKDLSFARFLENLSSGFNIFTYHHIHRAGNIIAAHFNHKAMEFIEDNDQTIGKFEAIGTQVSSAGGSFYTNAFVKYNPDWEASDEPYWKALLDTSVAMAPVFVSNHVTDEYEILVQDKADHLYLFNLMGQQLFKRKLPEPIKSSPVQVDAFKNGKLQVAFNTAHAIYLIDRDGNDVEGFPIELESPAQTELSVIEYDGKRDYRLLIACQDKRVHNYNIRGKKIRGWKHDKGSDLTIHPFKHLLVNGKDYLITGESSGKIHLLDRRGKNRVTVEKRIPPSKNNTLQVFRSSESAFTGVYITDPNGLIHRISLDGTVQSMDLGRFSPEHLFLVADLDANGRPEFIFYDLNMLQVFSYNKKKVFEQRIDPSAKRPGLIPTEDDKLGIGFYYADPQQLVLFDDKGRMFPGFPLSGNSMFDMVSAEEGWMVVSGGPGHDLLIQPLD